jgi:hypothetical protein
MKRSRAQFTILRLMLVVAVAALLLTPFSWMDPDSRWPHLLAIATIGCESLLIVIAAVVARRLPTSEKLPPCTATAERRGRARTGVTCS